MENIEINMRKYHMILYHNAQAKNSKNLNLKINFSKDE